MGVMTADRRRSSNPAVRAEPRAIGTARSRDPLAREVKLLGALLGQAHRRTGRPGPRRAAEAIRRRTIALRATDDPEVRARLGIELAAEFEALAVEDAELVIRAFALYFQLVNVAEERARVRGIRGRRRSAGAVYLLGSVRPSAPGVGRDRPGRAPGQAAVDRAGAQGPPDRGPSPDRPHRSCRIERLVERLHDLHLTPEEDGDIRWPAA